VNSANFTVKAQMKYFLLDGKIWYSFLKKQNTKDFKRFFSKIMIRSKKVKELIFQKF